MHASTAAFDPATVERVAWTIIHSLWLGLVIFVLLQVALLGLRRASAQARYLTLAVGLLLIVAAPAITLHILRHNFDDPGPLVLAVAESSQGSGESRVEARGARSIAKLVQFISPWLFFGWVTGVVAITLLHLFSWLWLQRVLLATAKPLRDGWANLTELAARLRLPAVRFLEATLTEVPATVGWLKPVVLLPPAALLGLTVQQVEAIVAHELAHVLRRDYLVNAIQTAAETLMFYHPAVWWVSRRLREERENCCDDIAASVSHGPRHYAAALLALEQQRHVAHPPKLVMAAKRGSLFRRIARLIGIDDKSDTSCRVRRPLVASLGVLSLLVFVAANAFASATAVRPARSLAEVKSLSNEVYDVLVAGDATGSLLPALETAVQEVRERKLTDRVGLALAVALRTAPPEELSREELSKVSLADPLAHQFTESWRYGTFYERAAIARSLWMSAQALHATDPEDARLLARAALLLSAQDSLLFGASGLRALLSQRSFAVVADLSSRQFARLQRHVEDHLTITRTFVEQLVRAERAVQTEPSSNRTIGIVEHMREMGQLAHRRPDIQWCIANFVLRHKHELAPIDPALVSDLIATVQSPTFAQWVSEDNPPENSPRRALPLTHRELQDYRNISRERLTHGETTEAPQP